MLQLRPFPTDALQLPTSCSLSSQLGHTPVASWPGLGMSGVSLTRFGQRVRVSNTKCSWATGKFWVCKEPLRPRPGPELPPPARDDQVCPQAPFGGRAIWRLPSTRALAPPGDPGWSRRAETVATLCPALGPKKPRHLPWARFSQGERELKPLEGVECFFPQQDWAARAAVPCCDSSKPPPAPSPQHRTKPSGAKRMVQGGEGEIHCLNISLPALPLRRVGGGGGDISLPALPLRRVGGGRRYLTARSPPPAGGGGRRYLTARSPPPAGGGGRRYLTARSPVPGQSSVLPAPAAPAGKAASAASRAHGSVSLPLVPYPPPHDPPRKPAPLQTPSKRLVVPSYGDVDGALIKASNVDIPTDRVYCAKREGLGPRPTLCQHCPRGALCCSRAQKSLPCSCCR
ncbi:unnamed protein product [Lepidochelys olivacea]